MATWEDALLEVISPTDQVFVEAKLIAERGYVSDHDLTETLADEW